MKKLILLALGATVAWGQANQQAIPEGKQSDPQPPFSHQYLKVQQYSVEEDSRILKLYDGLRVADIIDALDIVGLSEITMMDRHIRPLWRDEQKITHRIHGVALTIRIVPPQATHPHFTSHAEFRKYARALGFLAPPEMRTGDGLYSMGLDLVRPGTVVVMEGQGHDMGFCGSNNALTAVGKGLVGMVGDSVCRDQDELALTRIPVYQNPLEAPRGFFPGRMWVESYNQPVVVGGVLVMPGDIIVADNDGVAVVPRARAEDVAEIARWIFEDDEVARGKIYDTVGKPRDWTVTGHKQPDPPSDKPFKK